MKTLVVSAFPGCGKSFMTENNKKNQYIFYDKDNGYLSCDDDFKIYANEIISLIGKVDFLLISQYPEVLNTLYQKRVPYIIVAPNNSSYLSSNMRKIIKQQWFGRFYLRENNIDWIKLLRNNYDEWTSISHLQSMKPNRIILLDSCEYLNDILYDLEKMKKLYGIDFFNN